ncbi:glycosyltransferase family 1 protein [Priestia megaterium]
MEGPLRVLHVVVNMNRGGAETLIMNLYRNIDRSKVQFDFLTCKEGVFDSEIMEMGGQIHRIPYITEVGHAAYVKQLNQFFQENADYKIVHSHMDKMSGLVLRAAEKANISVRIAHSHNTQSEGGLASKVYKWYVGTNIKSSATHLFACSKVAAQWLFKKQSNETFILKNGIECNKFKFSSNVRNKIREELKLDNNSFIIGHVGRFNHQKNHLFLLEVFSQLTKIIPNAKLLLAGGGILQSNIEEKIKELHLEEKVSILGVREDIHLLLQAFDAFVFPSFHEGLPVTLIEAQGAGLPCIISDVITKEVDMGVGLVQYLPLNDKNEWVKTILKVTSSSSSRKVSEERLSQKGYNIRKTTEFIQKSYMEMGGTVS